MSGFDADFLLGSDVVEISRFLLGKSLFTRLPVIGHGERTATGASLTGGLIVETEAYAGVTDRASHAYGDRRTKRTETMYRRGGVAYVYLCYGIHSLLNVVTNREGVPHAVLIRAIQPTHGIEIMLKRRGLNRIEPRLCNGPGSLTRALGIDVHHDGTDLQGPAIWIEDTPDYSVADSDIVAAPRVGVAYAGPDAELPWRFVLSGNLTRNT